MPHIAAPQHGDECSCDEGGTEGHFHAFHLSLSQGQADAKHGADHEAEEQPDRSVTVKNNRYCTMIAWGVS